MRNGFYETTYFLQLNTEDALSDANYPLSGSYIDTKEYRRCGFLIMLGALDSALTFQVKQDTSATQTGSIKNLTGATVTTGTAGAGGDDYTYYIEFDTSALDVNNGFRYVTLAVSGSSGNDYAAVAFMGWLGRDMAITQASTFRSADHVTITSVVY